MNERNWKSQRYLGGIINIPKDGTDDTGMTSWHDMARLSILVTREMLCNYKTTVWMVIHTIAMATSGSLDIGVLRLEGVLLARSLVARLAMLVTGRLVTCWRGRSSGCSCGSGS